MAEEHATNTATDLRSSVSRSPESSSSHGAVHSAGGRSQEMPSDGTAKGILKEAIQKVMEEIQFHEKEAQKHRQQAEALKRDLRESFAFLQEQKGRGKTADGVLETAALRTQAKDSGNAQGPAHADTKKKHSAGRGKAKKG